MSQTQSERQKVVILGAGFGGAAAAEELARLLPRDEDCEITLVDQNNFLLFTPMLTEVAGGSVDTRHSATPIHRLSPRIKFMQGRVASVDVNNHCVTVSVGDENFNIPESRKTLQADHIVIALGSVTNYHHVPGLEEHSMPMKSLQDALALRNRAIALLERASNEQDANLRRKLLTFVVGGGGFSGVETVAALNDLARDSLSNYPDLREDELRVVLVHPDKRILPELSAGLAKYAHDALQERGVEIILNTKITGASEDSVQLEGGKEVESYTLVWTAGVTPNPLIGSLGLQTGKHHGLVVDSSLRVEGHQGLWALGDCAEIPKPGGKKTYAPTAQNATREGKHVARNIAAATHGRQPQPFRYTPIGELALVGKRTGVASLRVPIGNAQWHFSGLIAWAMWRAIYLAKVPHIATRFQVLTDWLLDFAFGRDTVVIPVQHSPAPTNRQGKQDQHAA